MSLSKSSPSQRHRTKRFGATRPAYEVVRRLLLLSLLRLLGRLLSGFLCHGAQSPPFCYRQIYGARILESTLFSDCEFFFCDKSFRAPARDGPVCGFAGAREAQLSKINGRRIAQRMAARASVSCW